MLRKAFHLFIATSLSPFWISSDPDPLSIVQASMQIWEMRIRVYIPSESSERRVVLNPSKGAALYCSILVPRCLGESNGLRSSGNILGILTFRSVLSRSRNPRIMPAQSHLLECALRYSEQDIIQTYEPWNRACCILTKPLYYASSCL